MACSRVPAELLRGLGLTTPPIEILGANDTYVVVVEDQETVRGLRPDFSLLERIFPCSVVVTSGGTESDFVSRYFAPGFGLPEDPVTGSSHCILAPYWAGRLAQSRFHARQLSQRGGELWCELKEDRVLLEGHAVLIFEGSLVE